jgi:hypothetical protein
VKVRPVSDFIRNLTHPSPPSPAGFFMRTGEARGSRKTYPNS